MLPDRLSNLILLVAWVLLYGCQPSANENKETVRVDAPIEETPLKHSYPDDYEKPDNSNTDFRDYEAVVAVLKRWNEATNAQQMQSLDDLYSDKVTYYMKELSKEKLLAKKKAAFEKHPTYYQEIAYIDICYPDGEQAVAKCLFDKIYRADVEDPIHENDTVRALLELDVSTEPYTIIKESDKISELRIAKNLEPANILLPKGYHSFSHIYWRDLTDDDRGFIEGYTTLSILYTEDTIEAKIDYKSSNGPGFAMGHFYKDVQLMPGVIRFKASGHGLDRYYMLEDRISDGEATFDEIVPDSEFDDYYYKIIDFNTIVQIDKKYQEATVFKRDLYKRPKRNDQTYEDWYKEIFER